MDIDVERIAAWMICFMSQEGIGARIATCEETAQNCAHILGNTNGITVLSVERIG